MEPSFILDREIQPRTIELNNDIESELKASTFTKEENLPIKKKNKNKNLFRV